MANEILGAKSYLALSSEDLWGSTPADSSGTASGSTQEWRFIPVTDYGVRFRPENRQSVPFTGIFQRKHSKNFRGAPSGQIVCPLYGWEPPGSAVSHAQYLVDWAFGNHESTDLPSKTAWWAEGPDVANVEHTGLRVNQAVIAGSDATGQVNITLDVIGKAENAGRSADGALAIPDDMNKLVDFEYQDVTLTLGGNSVLTESFRLQIQHSLNVRYFNSYTPSYVFKTDRVVTFQIVLVKNANTYDAYRRATTTTELAGTLVIKGLHNGTGAAGTYTQASISLPRLSLIDVDETRTREELSTQPINFIALKPDTTANDMTITWSTP